LFALALQSGSNGNCFYVEASGVRLLFDAGISGVQAEHRLKMFGRDIRRVDAVVISHDHNDHVRCAGVLQRRYGLPIYATRATLDAARRRCAIGDLEEFHPFRAGDALDFGAVRVETFPTPHDAADAAAFVVAHRDVRLGILTDLGHVFAGLPEIVASLDAGFIESNYDPEMLANGPYPLFLQERIRGAGGHLSNVESAELLRLAGSPDLRWVCLAHLSQNNNTPDIAIETHTRLCGSRRPLFAASRYEPTGPFTL